MNKTKVIIASLLLCLATFVIPTVTYFIFNFLFIHNHKENGEELMNFSEVFFSVLSFLILIAIQALWYFNLFEYLNNRTSLLFGKKDGEEGFLNESLFA